MGKKIADTAYLRCSGADEVLVEQLVTWPTMPMQNAKNPQKKTRRKKSTHGFSPFEDMNQAIQPTAAMRRVVRP